MIRQIRIELLKLTTVRLTYGLLAFAAALTGIFSAIESGRAGTSDGVAPLNTYSGLSAIVTGGVWGLIFAAVLGATVSSGEFRHHTATLTYLATPNRTRVLAAKAAAGAVGGAVFGLVVDLIATGVGLGFVAGHHYPVSIGAVTFVRFGRRPPGGRRADGQPRRGARVAGPLPAGRRDRRLRLVDHPGVAASAGCSPRSGPTCRTPRPPAWPAPPWAPPGSAPPVPSAPAPRCRSRPPPPC